MADVLTLYHSLQGGAVSASVTPDGNVQVAAGAAVVNNQAVSWAATTLTPGAADATLDRQDAVVVDSSGPLILAGSTADGASAQPPDTTGYAPLADVYVINQASAEYTATIVAAAITDARVFVLLPEPANTMAFTFASGALSNTDPGAYNFGFDSSTIASITAAYVSYSSFTVGGANKTWFIPGTIAVSNLPFLLRVWSRKAPANWMELNVTAVASHGAGPGTYVELTCSIVRASTAVSTVQLSTDTADTIFEYIGPVVTVPTTWTIANKTANTARANTTALAADPALQFAMAANTNYIIRGTIRFDSTSATPGIKFDFDGPASPTRVMVAIRDAAQAGTPAAIALESTLNNAHTLSTGAGGTPGLVQFEAIIENGANAGTFSFRWAQSVSNGTNVNVRPGSYLEHLVS